MTVINIYQPEIKVNISYSWLRERALMCNEYKQSSSFTSMVKSKSLLGYAVCMPRAASQSTATESNMT